MSVGLVLPDLPYGMSWMFIGLEMIAIVGYLLDSLFVLPRLMMLFGLRLMMPAISFGDNMYHCTSWGS